MRDEKWALINLNLNNVFIQKHIDNMYKNMKKD